MQSSKQVLKMWCKFIIIFSIVNLPETQLEICKQKFDGAGRFNFYEISAYKFIVLPYEEGVLFEERDLCRKNNGRLLEIQNKEENKVVYDFVIKRFYGDQEPFYSYKYLNYWIGGRKFNNREKELN